MEKKSGIVDLSKTIEIDSEKVLKENKEKGLFEEKQMYHNNMKLFSERIAEIKSEMPFPKVDQYATAWDYEDKFELDNEKIANKKYWDRQQIWEKLKLSTTPYVGRVDIISPKILSIDSNASPSQVTTYYITEKVKTPDDNKPYVVFVNADDSLFNDVVKAWSNGDDNYRVTLRRNISFNVRAKDAEISRVDTIYEEGEDFLNNISDVFLREVLLRNKQNPSFQSIIQTIQKKQFEIRVLPKNESFIVQGCAGSGKTIVMLQRLRYLFYNYKDLEDSEYIILTPSKSFVKYINSVANEFHIKVDSIDSHKGYFAKHGVGNGTISDKSEFGVSPDVLKKVYSEDFIRDSYYEFIDLAGETLEDMLSISSKKAEECKETIKTLEEKLDNLNKEESLFCIERKKEIIEAYNHFIIRIPYINLSELFGSDLVSIKSNKSIIEKYCEDLESNKQEAKRQYEEYCSKFVNSDLNDALNTIDQQIIEANYRLNKASVFTKKVYQERIEELLKNKEEISKKINEQNNNVQKEILLEKCQKYESVNVEKIRNEYLSIFNGVIEYERKCDIFRQNKDLLKSQKSTTEKNLNYYNENIEYVNSNGQSIVSLIDKHRKELSCFPQKVKQFIKNTKQFYEHEKINNDLVKKYQSEDELIKTVFYEYLKIELEKMGQKVSGDYKYELFARAYFSYIVKGPNKPAKLICIDEAQDLCPLEIDLIKKMNPDSIINLYGDLDQVITQNGVSNWGELKGYGKVYNLNQNFRNTNQIIDYCNQRFIHMMENVGVFGEDVKEYTSLEDYLKSINFNDELIFIVKNEDVKDKFEKQIRNRFRNKCSIYTVFESKGLEFYSVTVLNTGMTDNELYISCTRALMNLSVINME